MTLIVNLIGGPGSGKSTTGAATFAMLKWAGVNAELVTEYAKDLVWGRTTETLGNQIYIFGKQYHRLWRLLGQVDVVVTDCPLFLSMYYGEKQSDAFRTLVLETFRSMDNITFYLNRVKPFNPAGRLQSEEKALDIDQRLYDMLDEHEVDAWFITADRDAPTAITERVLEALTERRSQ